MMRSITVLTPHPENWHVGDTYPPLHGNLLVKAIDGHVLYLARPRRSILGWMRTHRG